MWVVDALVADQPAGIGVVARGFLAGAAGRDDVVALVAPGVRSDVRQEVVGLASRNAGRLLVQRSGLVLRHVAAHRPARFLAMDAFSLPVALPSGARAYVHDLLPFTQGEYWGRVNRAHKRSSIRTACRRGAELVVSSAVNAEEVDRLLGRPSRVVGYGCGQLTDDDADRRLAAGPVASRADHVVVVGNVQPRKRLDELVEAFALATAGGSGVELVVVGDGEPAHVGALRDQARRLGAAVRWAGRLPWQETAPLLEAARAVVFASRHEGFGLPVLEALAMGTRPIAADVPAVRSWAGDWPVYFPAAADRAARVEGLASAIDSVLGVGAWDARGAMRAVAHRRWRTFADELLAG